MPAIFFDLETSDKDFIGQILNFSFIVVDNNYTIIDEFSGDIRISCLQLPSPSAILANRVDVLRHQEISKLNEQEFSKKLFEFIQGIIDDSREPVYFIGYNSFRFDVPYLRTVLIRNGISPYFNGKLIYRDLLSAARKLSVSNKDFPRAPESNAKGDDTFKLSLRLQTLTQNLGLLTGEQTHHSRDDTLLTIELAKVFQAKYGMDVRKYDPYEGVVFHKYARSGEVFWQYEPQYNLKDQSIFQMSPVTILDANPRYALWINLVKYKSDPSDKACVSYQKSAGSSMICGPGDNMPVEYIALAKEALNKYKQVNINNFFARSHCDIEMDIYRIDFDGIDLLHRAIWQGKKEELKKKNNRDLTAIYVRNMLSNCQDRIEDNPAFSAKLVDYARYRYGGELVLSKGVVVDEKEQKRHVKLSDMHKELSALRESGSNSNKELLNSLEKFYEQSAIVRLAPELLY